MESGAMGISQGSAQETQDVGVLGAFNLEA